MKPLFMDIMDISAPFTDKDAGVPAVQATFNTQVPQVTCKTQSQRKTEDFSCYS